jgi:HAD superfamily hydrolase (TIGR01549 family)
MRAVIFDLDGTLLDGREGIYWQYEQLTREFDGASASRKEIAAAMHGTLDDVVRALIKNDTVPFEEIRNRHEELIIESLAHLQLYDGVTELLPILRRIGVRIGAVASGDGHTVKALETMGIKQYFDIVISADHVSQPKPHPEGIQMVLTHMDVPAHEAAMVGDTTSDILAGKNANLAKTIAVTHGFGQFEELHEAGATHIVDDIPSLLDVLDARVEP